MCCEACGVGQRKAWVFGFGTFFAVIGLVMLIFWKDIADSIKRNVSNQHTKLDNIYSDFFK